MSYPYIDKLLKYVKQKYHINKININKNNNKSNNVNTNNNNSNSKSLCYEIVDKYIVICKRLEARPRCLYNSSIVQGLSTITCGYKYWRCNLQSLQKTNESENCNCSIGCEYRIKMIFLLYVHMNFIFKHSI